MKTLYESILSSTKSGIKPAIEKWCIDHNIFDGDFKINPDNTISHGKTTTLYLHFEDYSELPDYIKFKGDPDLNVNISPSSGKYVSSMKQITSFKGLPELVRALIIKSDIQVLPELKIDVLNVFSIYSPRTKEYKNLEINFKDNGNTHYGGECSLKTSAPLKNVKIKGVKVLNVVNDFNLGDDFSKAMIRKAELNKYRGKYTTPVTDAGLEVINTFFGDAIDMSKLQEIDYTQNSRVVKHDGKWYRCKNW